MTTLFDAADSFAASAIFDVYGADADGEPNAILRPDGEVDTVALRAIIDIDTEPRIEDFIGQTNEQIYLISLFLSECPDNVAPSLDSTVEADSIVYELAELIRNDGLEVQYRAKVRA